MFLAVLWISCNCAFAAGLAGSALLFDGADDYVHAAYIDAYQSPGFTYEVWINPNVDLSQITDHQVILDRGEDPDSDNASFRFYADRYGRGLALSYEDNSDYSHYFYTDFFPATNNWTHVAATRSVGGVVSIYANGGLLKRWESSSAPTDNSFQEISIGSAINSIGGVDFTTHFFEGIIDECAGRGRRFPISPQHVSSTSEVVKI